MKVIVIGGGPAGLMAAIKASETNEVTLIEKNEKVGMKIYITGKGRCNVTNNCTTQEFIQNMVTNPKFMYSSINKFNSQAVMNFFESQGVELVTERGNRVFPYSYHASDITKALLNKCLENRVVFKYLEAVISITKKEEGFLVKTNKNIYLVDKVIIATGGKSYPHTGSTGDGYKFAESFSLDVVEPVQGLVPLLIRDEIPRELYNFTFKNVQLSAFNHNNHKLIHQEFGELMTCKNSIAGPITLTISSLINRMKPCDVDLEIDFKPALTNEMLENRIRTDIDDLKHKANANAYILIRRLVPVGFIPVVLQRMGIDGNLRIKLFDFGQNVNNLIETLKHFKLSYKGLEDFNRAIITSGGVSVKELDPKTLESKKVPGLYFCGEVIDVDAFTGGFNMQVALCTGYSAGDSLNKIEK